jgi:hypothetical protein
MTQKPCSLKPYPLELLPCCTLHIVPINNTTHPSQFTSRSLMPWKNEFTVRAVNVGSVVTKMSVRQVLHRARRSSSVSHQSAIAPYLLVYQPRTDRGTSDVAILKKIVQNSINSQRISAVILCQDMAL